MNCKDQNWMILGRPGFSGFSRDKRDQKLNKLFGEGNWRIRHLYRERVLERTEALALYEEGYFQHFRRNPKVLEWLCQTASDIFDISPSNVNSGQNYFIQECKATHLQDIAIRRCMNRLECSFQGNHLLEIRGRNSEGFRLNPGKIPFHDPEAIFRPSLSMDTWWDEASIEDFWQSNKILQVNRSVPESAIREYALTSLEPPLAGKVRIAIFGGSFNPIHNGHLQIARELLDRSAFSRVIFVPNGEKYKKKDLISPEVRLEMVKLAIQNEPRFEICDFEINQERLIHSIETLNFIYHEICKTLERFELFFIRGSDNIKRMLGWESLQELLKFKVIVPMRPGFEPWDTFGRDPRFLLHCDRFRYMVRDFEDGISSSIVRKYVRQGYSVEYLVPTQIKDYIQNKKLYRV